MLFGLGFLIILLFYNEVALCNKPRSSVLQLRPNYLHRARYIDVRRLPVKKPRTPPKFDPPKVVCGADYIGIVLTSPFTGRIYTSHKETLSECVKYFHGSPAARFQLDLANTQCGVRQIAQDHASVRGITFLLRVIVSFAFDELTEDDRIFDLKCAHNIQKTLSLEAFYDSRELLNRQVLYATDVPKCHYSLHLNSLDGSTVDNAKVGDMIYHRWVCNSNIVHFRVYRCFVHNGNKQSFMLVDDKGCSLDEEILPHPSYDLSTNTVYTPSKAFRFSRSKRVHFNCLLAVCSKSDKNCMKGIPPHCPRSQKKRHLPDNISVEERLLRIHAALNGLNVSDLLSSNQMAIESNALEILEASTIPEEEEEDLDSTRPIPISRPSIDLCWNAVGAWLIGLLISNCLSFAMLIIACARLFKNRYSLQIHQSTRHCLRRIPGKNYGYY